MNYKIVLFSIYGKVAIFRLRCLVQLTGYILVINFLKHFLGLSSLAHTLILVENWTVLKIFLVL